MPIASPSDLHQHTLAKLARVLGDERAQALLTELLAHLPAERVRNLDDLERISEILQGRRGIDAAVGAMLAVDVAMFRLREPRSRP